MKNGLNVVPHQESKTALIQMIIISAGACSCIGLIIPFISIQALRKDIKLKIFVWLYVAYDLSCLFGTATFLSLLKRNKYLAKSLFSIGIAMIGICTILWGFLDPVVSLEIYIGLGSLLNMFIALGTVFTILFIDLAIEQLYPVQCTIFYGILATACIATYILILPLLGLLSQAYGHDTAFFVFGGLFLIIAITNFPKTVNPAKMPGDLVDHVGFSGLFGVWVGRIMTFIDDFGRSFIFVSLTASVWDKTKQSLNISMLFVVNRIGYFVIIHAMSLVRCDMKTASYSIQTALIIKMLCFLFWSGPEILHAHKMSESIDYVYIVLFVVGISDAMIAEGSFFILKHNALVNKSLENIHTCKMVIRNSRIFNNVGSIFGTLAAGFLTSAVTFPISWLILSYTYGFIALLFIPFMKNMSKVEKTSLSPDSHYMTSQSHRHYLKSTELHNSLNKLEEEMKTR